MQCENGYIVDERVEYTLILEDGAISEQMDNSTSSEDLPRMQKDADDEELNYLICQTFSIDKGVPSMNHISTQNATRSKKGYKLNQNNKKKMNSYLTGERCGNYFVQNNKYDAKHRRIYSKVLKQAALSRPLYA